MNLPRNQFWNGRQVHTDCFSMRCNKIKLPTQLVDVWLLTPAGQTWLKETTSQLEIIDGKWAFHLHNWLVPSSALRPVTQMVASSADAAIRSSDKKSSPWMMENVQSGDVDTADVDDNPPGETPCTSDVWTHRTSRILAMATAKCTVSFDIISFTEQLFQDHQLRYSVHQTIQRSDIL